jgi:hypothetical protein
MRPLWQIPDIPSEKSNIRDFSCFVHCFGLPSLHSTLSVSFAAFGVSDHRGAKGKVTMPLQLSLYDNPITLQVMSGSGSISRLTSTPQNNSNQANYFALAFGVCRFCGCHGDACLDRCGDRCGWTDSTHTCCTGESCRVRLNLNHPSPATCAPVPPVRIVSSAMPGKPTKRRVFRGSSVARAWDRYLTR